MNSKLLISGASGLIGTALVSSLTGSSWTVIRLVRGEASGENEISWEPEKPFPPGSVSGFDAVIHLAGENIFGRWTEAKKAKILASRVKGTTNLSNALAQAEEKPKVFICGSAVGYYGSRGNEGLHEESAPGSGFLANVCQRWEEATMSAVQADIRTAHLRTGVVLSQKGGALKTMLLPFKLGVGGRVGDGRQWMSWIDIQDFVGAIHHILKNDLLQGAINMVAPQPVTNADFTKVLAGVLSRPAILPMPEFAVKGVFGEMGVELLLSSQKVEPRKLISSGYPFRFRELKGSLRHLLKS